MQREETKKEPKFHLSRKGSVIEPNTYRIPASFTSNQSSNHSRSQSNFLSSRTSPFSRADNSRSHASPNSRIRTPGGGNQIPKPKTQNNLRAILKRDFQHQQTQHQSSTNQTSYSNLEKSKIISSLMQDSSMVTLKSQMMKIALNQSSSVSKQVSSNMDLIQQICKQKSSENLNTWGLSKKQNENNSSNISFNSTRAPVPNTKDALFKSLLRKNSAIISTCNQQQQQQIGTGMNSIIFGQRSNLSVNREIDNKENNDLKTVMAPPQMYKSNQSLQYSKSRDNLKGSSSNSIKTQQKTVDTSNLTQKLQKSQQDSQILQQQKLPQNLPSNTHRDTSKLQQKQKYPQYFQINLSEYIKQNNKNMENQSTIQTNSINKGNSQPLAHLSQQPHNIYSTPDNTHMQEPKQSLNFQYQQIGVMSHSENINSIEQNESGYDQDNIYRISTVKDTENSMLHDFRLEKNYIFLN